MSLLLSPAPVSCRTGKALFPLPDAILLVPPESASPALLDALERFCARAAALTGKQFSCLPAGAGSQLPAGAGNQHSASARGRKSPWRLIIDQDVSNLPAQGYRLLIDTTGLRLEASDEAGAYYGLQTLLQILTQRTDALPDLEIEDYPDFPIRGYMLDISRCKVPRMKSLFELVDRMAAFKLNSLQLYVEHTFAFADHERVWRGASPLSADDIRLLDSYCRARYIELVPNFNSFGHFGKWLKHPQYRHLAECPDGFESPEGQKSPYGSTLKPDDDSLRLLDQLYSEYLPNFSSDKFNVGCDETWELGLGWSRPQAEKTSRFHVYLEFLKKIHALVTRHDRKMLFWADMILKNPASLADLPRDATALVWGYEADHPFSRQCELFANNGLHFYVAPGTSSWFSLGGRLDNALANIDNAVSNGLANSASGILLTDWGDGGHHQFPMISYPAIVYCAALSWHRKTNLNPGLEDTLNRFIFYDSEGSTARIILALGQAADPIGKKISNGTPLFDLLFCKEKDLDGHLSGISETELENVCRQLRQIEDGLEGANPRCADAGLIKREISLTVTMLLQAAHRGLNRLTKDSSGALTHRQRSRLIEDFEECWLSRNRKGGLAESSKRLRSALAGC